MVTIIIIIIEFQVLYIVDINYFSDMNVKTLSPSLWLVFIFLMAFFTMCILTLK
jgi:hypothetical protein